MREIGDAREPYPGYFTTTKYVRNNGIISHMHIPHMHAVPAPPHQEKMVPRKAYPGYARVLHPGYFTNKYPLWAKSNIPQTRTHHRLPYWYRTRTPAHRDSCYTDKQQGVIALRSQLPRHNESVRHRQRHGSAVLVVQYWWH